VPSIRAAAARDAGPCAAIVADLDDFFTDDVPDKVRDDLRSHGGWVIEEAGGVVGFVITERRGARAAEILWAAVAADHRAAGLGTWLIDHVLEELGSDGVQIVEVKTLDASAGYAPYEATRAFWLARGFVQLDVIDPLPDWPPGNPAAILAAALAPTRAQACPGARDGSVC
jgi:GNAT superfamily N-acetyltransferase